MAGFIIQFVSNEQSEEEKVRETEATKGQIGPINDAKEREKSGNSLTTGNGSLSQVSPWLPTLSFTNIDKQNYILEEEEEEMTCDV